MRLTACLLSTGFALSTTGTSVLGQAIETNPAQILIGEQSGALPDPDLSVSGDDMPLGVVLRSIVIVDSAQTPGLVRSSVRGIDVSKAAEELKSPRLTMRLTGFLNRPLSRKLISEITVTVTRYMRDIGRPLVAVTVPPQEVTDGSLQISVREYVLAEKRAEGNERTSDSYILGTVRAQRGEPVDSEQLLDDINWLNQNPFRNSVVVFEPGAKPGTTDLAIRTTEGKPWRVYTGASYYGVPEGDDTRLFAGINFANPFLPEHQIGYQLTVSPDAFASGNLFELGQDLGYVSHAGSYFAPIDYGNGVRHKLRIDASYVQSGDELTVPFTQSSDTLSVYGDYATPLSAIDGVEAETYGGVDFKQQKSNVFFGGVLSTSTTLNILQVVGGIRGSYGEQSPTGGVRNSFDLRLVYSPGDLLANNDDAAFVAASGDPDARASYVYAYGEITHTTALSSALVARTKAAVQGSPQILPGVEQIALGGKNSVRGYATNELTGEVGAFAQNELRWISLDLSGDSAGRFAAQPFSFLDIGSAYDIGNDTTQNLLSAGLGIDLAAGRNLTASVAGAVSLVAGPKTRAYAPSVYADVTASF
ncbi:ShlB/FhaC/HecB family hemolysin secretion/activation protein [Oricola indica]|uniref:ShlB/FhaC/HecB family hemolysin secretion/activation protein n=1 Tax=Oricola indica TaxID=2872591 RepID=UPI001CBED9B3|nr:ShlB/FhaC/HecB family hemolysin secretion/activation protein [Oricola indica]